jgi:hypothetical protein
MSDMSNWLKAGLIGAAVIVGLNLVGWIPCVGCFTWILGYVAYGCIGALSAYWMPPVRAAGPAAGQGALAGVIAGAIGGLVGLVLAMFGIAVFGPLAALGETLGGLEGAGFDPSVFFEMGASVVGTIVCGTSCYAVGVGIAAGLGALGGLIFAIIRPD